MRGTERRRNYHDKKGSTMNGISVDLAKGVVENAEYSRYNAKKHYPKNGDWMRYAEFQWPWSLSALPADRSIRAPFAAGAQAPLPDG